MRRNLLLILALLALLCGCKESEKARPLADRTAGTAAVELDKNRDGKIDDDFIPTTITRDSELATKQDALGYTPEDAANKGTANGYAGLGSDGKVPTAQLPESTGTDDQTITDFSLSGSVLSLTLEGGNTVTVDLSSIMGGTDDQTVTDLSLSGEILSITLEDGNTATVDLSEIVGSGGASIISDLTDVDTTGKSEGKILVFNASGDLVVGDDQIGAEGTGDITDVVAGTGLTGGATAGSATLNLADTAVTAGDYTYGSFTVDAQGRITAASNGTAPVTAESDPVFSAWDKDYADLINTPTALVADTDYLTPPTAATTYQPLMGVDDNYVTDAEKTIIGNTSGTNTGDQDLSGYLEKTNTTEFTPTGDYNPATKKYVDDNISAGGMLESGSYTPTGTWDWTSATATWPTFATMFGSAPSITVGTLNFSHAYSTADDGDQYGEIVNTVAITANATLGRYAWYNGEMRVADGTDWEGHFLRDAHIGVSVQAYDADLTTWAGVTPSANGQSLVSAADYTAMIALLNLEIGTDVQAYDANMISWPSAIDATEVGYLDGLTESLSTSLSGKVNTSTIIQSDDCSGETPTAGVLCFEY